MNIRAVAHQEPGKVYRAVRGHASRYAQHYLFACQLFSIRAGDVL
jgi:hypothetical protein